MLLKKLTEASGVSGNEKEVRDIILNEIKGYVDDINVDRLGNIIAFKKGNNSSKKLMVTAHMDEVGLMVTDIDNMGLLKFTTVGGIDKRILVSKPVLVGKDKILGVIGAKPIHLQKREEWQKALEIEQLYIDIGVNSKAEAEKLVSIGDYAMFDSQYIEFGGNLVKAKALDNRVGCSLLIELLKEIEDMVTLAEREANDPKAQFVNFLKSNLDLSNSDIKTVTDRAKMVNKRINDMYELQADKLKRQLLRNIRKAEQEGNEDLAAKLKTEFKEKYGAARRS